MFFFQVALRRTKADTPTWGFFFFFFQLFFLHFIYLLDNHNMPAKGLLKGLESVKDEIFNRVHIQK